MQNLRHGEPVYRLDQLHKNCPRRWAPAGSTGAIHTFGTVPVLQHRYIKSQKGSDNAELVPGGIALASPRRFSTKQMLRVCVCAGASLCMCMCVHSSSISLEKGKISVHLVEEIALTTPTFQTQDRTAASGRLISDRKERWQYLHTIRANSSSATRDLVNKWVI